ncbi:hypothetical protein [Helicobacter zhangjianzhongii]|uniref:Uncharacterized protein n=1 Tax=Helicobacter zhangjianzhongii TaxID=2974574 RepID=A0ACC6FQZ9_9HELI|nr:MULTISPECIES: hypothetical protein [unclassified Helicobacter]MDL0079406.1 hypothetical protein [Helicobacter sp. CPD2-1]MDL0081694.1 hypothetical protein [Helicobacter sp. XJK30-2]
MVLNESFKALVREAFPNNSDKVISVFDEVISHKASTDRVSVDELKSRAIDEIKGELATKDFVRAEISSAKVEILKWVFGLQAGTIAILIGAMKYMLG